MTNVRVINNSKITLTEPKKLKGVVLDSFRNSYIGLSEISVIILDNLGKAHETYKGTYHILFQAVPALIRTIGEEVDINGFKVKEYVTNEVDDSYAKLSENGLYYHSEEYQEIYVPFDLSGLSEEEVREFIKYTLSVIEMDVLQELNNRDSWTRSKQKDLLANRIKAYLRKNNTKRINDKKEQIRERENSLESLKQKIIKVSRELPILRNEISALEGNEVEGLDDYMNGLDMIAKHPKVSNLIIEENIITVYVDKIITRALVGEQEKNFFMGDMHFTIDINNAKVRFFGNEVRHGQWTTKDPHPHVSGADGGACLGNAEPIITELSAQLQIYPLFLTLLDFVQNANTADVAGAKVTRWDECTPEGVKLKDIEKEEAKKKVAKPKRTLEKEQTVRAIVDVNLNTAQIEASTASSVATYVAYEGYIGYVLNEALEKVEQLLAEGAVVR